ncbi:hypothetical protein ACFVY4_26700 [Streptomyces sp. NPDC058299]|uniref:hypothetical protein n=1 Tax=Streptomyces sp. NPDC058299 TaxID=3346435 RepID=UPI0036E80219
MPKHTHTARKEAARELADDEGLGYAEARRIIERWAAHQPPTSEELEAADEVSYDPVLHYAMTPPSEIPGWMMRTIDFPMRVESPSPYCYAHRVQSLSDREQHAVLSLFARPAIYDSEAALVVEPFTFTPPADTRIPRYGHWGNCWTVELHDAGFRYNRVSHLAAPGWSATITRGPEPSAPCRLRVAHDDGYVLFDEDTPLPPDWLARTGVHPEGVPVFCGPGAGLPVPPQLDKEEADLMLETADLIVARIPFTVREA